MTKKMAISAGSTSLILEHHATTAPVEQVYRELGQNGIEAIRRARAAGTLKGKGFVTFDVDWPYFYRTGIYKLCVIDNGDGMTKAEFEKNLNSLYVNGANMAQGMRGNFGIGAKVTALFHNPYGLMYESWKGNKGFRAILHKDPKTGEYGLKRLGGTARNPLYFEDLEGSDKTSDMPKTGTKVTLLGRNEKDHTFEPPEGREQGGATNWLHKLFNQRYFTLDADIAIRGRTMPSDRSKWSAERGDGKNSLHSAHGISAILGDYSTSKGTIKLSTAKVHWWVFPPRDELPSSMRAHARGAGHAGVVYQNECYWVRSGTVGYGALAAFGVKFAQDQIVLYVEPDAERIGLHSNGARSELYIGGKAIDKTDAWEIWGREFENRLPGAIHKVIGERLSRLDEEEKQRRSESLKQHFARYADLFRASPYRASRKGKIQAMACGEAGQKLSEPTGKTGKGLARTYKSLAPDYLTKVVRDGGTRAVEVRRSGKGGLAIPDDIVWARLEDKSRLPGEMEDLAAEIQGCAMTSDSIKINEDYRGFQDIFRALVSYYGAWDNLPAKMKILGTLKDYYQRKLVEAIVVGRTYANANSKLTIEDRRTRLSSMVLTGAMADRSGIFTAVKRSLKHEDFARRDAEGPLCEEVE